MFSLMRPVINTLRVQSQNMCSYIRPGGVWPKVYQEPIIQPKELDTLKDTNEDRHKLLTYNPIKSQHHFASNSVFFDKDLFKFEGVILRRGDRIGAHKAISNTLFHIKRIQLKKYHAEKNENAKKSIELNPLKLFKNGFNNCQPLVTTGLIVRSGSKYQVPKPITADQGAFIATKWIRDSLRERPRPRKISFAESLAKELLLANVNEGKIVKKKNDLHKLCETNKAYVHYRWA